VKLLDIGIHHALVLDLVSSLLPELGHNRLVPYKFSSASKEDTHSDTLLILLSEGAMANCSRNEEIVGELEAAVIAIEINDGGLKTIQQTATCKD
jgi:hypothetical protein